MATEVRMTVSELSESIRQQFGPFVPIWKLRRVVDSLESQQRLEVQRIANYRTICTCDVLIVVDELRRLGWFQKGAV